MNTNTSTHFDNTLKALKEQREHWLKQHACKFNSQGRILPSTEHIHQLTEQWIQALYPLILGPDKLSFREIDAFVALILSKTERELIEQIILEQIATTGSENRTLATEQAQTFIESLVNVRTLIDTDIEAAYCGDPAAKSHAEILLCYPGVRATIHHRIAHVFYQMGLTLIARIISEKAHSETGIDIHPGAQIDESFFIDHGTGVVIGETCIIGKHVRIYQAVTLGARSFPSDENGNLKKDLPRHPIIEDHVVIYASATILGRITIGHHSVIGGNVWLMKDIAPHSSVKQADCC